MDNRFTTINQRNAQTSSLNIYITISPLTFLHILCFVDRASRYNRVKKYKFDTQLILSTFRQPLHVRAYLGPSSGGTTVGIQQLVLIILFR